MITGGSAGSMTISVSTRTTNLSCSLDNDFAMLGVPVDDGHRLDDMTPRTKGEFENTFDGGEV